MGVRTIEIKRVIIEGIRTRIKEVERIKIKRKRIITKAKTKRISSKAS